MLICIGLFQPGIAFLFPGNMRKPFVFLMFAGGTAMQYWPEMGEEYFFQNSFVRTAI